MTVLRVVSPGGIHSNAACPRLRHLCHRRRHHLSGASCLCCQLVDHVLPIRRRMGVTSCTSTGIKKGRPPGGGRRPPFPRTAPIRRRVPIPVAGRAILVRLVEPHDVGALGQKVPLAVGEHLAPDHGHERLVRLRLVRWGESRVVHLGLRVPVPPEVHLPCAQHRIQAAGAIVEPGRSHTTLQRGCRSSRECDGQLHGCGGDKSNETSQTRNF
mmetsp:Transcript_38346/g.93894  ORF Transcript_38346/g.93894 Transcript_38346/m.93894 type:complete len:213 (-) Transcript_38346:36-674(-)